MLKICSKCGKKFDTRYIDVYVCSDCKKNYSPSECKKCIERYKAENDNLKEELKEQECARVELETRILRLGYKRHEEDGSGWDGLVPTAEERREAKQATPNDILAEQLMNPNVPKSEREHYAVRIIEEKSGAISRLSAALAEAEKRAEHEYTRGYADRYVAMNENGKLSTIIDDADKWRIYGMLAGGTDRLNAILDDAEKWRNANAGNCTVDGHCDWVDLLQSRIDATEKRVDEYKAKAEKYDKVACNWESVQDQLNEIVEDLQVSQGEAVRILSKWKVDADKWRKMKWHTSCSHEDADCAISPELENTKSDLESILSVLEKVKKCPECSTIRGPKLETCICHGTGIVWTEVTVEDVKEYLAWSIGHDECYRLKGCAHSGDIIRRKK